eukprot:TRINITY_DN10001_c0_g1_i1.p1 TRINITY_DN10001_c0_g1~~TRINITY_DN10001_c0_g1_i1.p1  ORF type:complete len:108 (-),score=57.85 TRINITY_DN10001_c0_g1_i1:10-333(-)
MCIRDSTSEYIRGIKAIKLNAWEDFALKKSDGKIAEAKACEIKGRFLSQINSGQREIFSQGVLIGALLVALWNEGKLTTAKAHIIICLLYTSPSPRDLSTSRMPSSA